MVNQSNGKKVNVEENIINSSISRLISAKSEESIVLELAQLNGLEESFMDWLENSNYFCNSLVTG